MPPAHRTTDLRACGAFTVSTQTSQVYVNGLLWAVDGDPNSEGGGSLFAGSNKVYIGGRAVVNYLDPAAPDALCPIPGGAHCAPFASMGSPNVNVGD